MLALFLCSFKILMIVESQISAKAYCWSEFFVSTCLSLITKLKGLEHWANWANLDNPQACFLWGAGTLGAFIWLGLVFSAGGGGVLSDVFVVTNAGKNCNSYPPRISTFPNSHYVYMLQNYIVLCISNGTTCFSKFGNTVIGLEQFRSLPK